MEWIKNFPIELDYEYNPVTHQLDNNECGVYVIHYIVRMMFGVPFEKIVGTIIRDVEMNSVYRPNYFNPFG